MSNPPLHPGQAVAGPGESWGNAGLRPAQDEHVPIDSEEEEPTLQAGKKQVLVGYGGAGVEPTHDRQSGRGSRPPVPLYARGTLVVIAGTDSGREFPLTGQPVTIGRALDNHVVLRDIAVSRKHMCLEFDGTRYRLVDQGSGNGTVINGRLETGSWVLTDGDQMEAGNTVLRFDHPASRGLARQQPVASGIPASPMPASQTSSRRIIPLQPASEPEPPGGRGPLPAPAWGEQRGQVPLPGVPPQTMPPVAAQQVLPQGFPEPIAPRPGLPGSDMAGNQGVVSQLAPEAFMSTAPVYRYGALTPVKSGSRKVVGLLVVAVGTVLVAILALLLREQGFKLPFGDLNLAGNPAGEAGDAAPADPSSPTDTGKQIALRELPESTWGTSETMLITSIGTPVGKTPAGKAVEKPVEPPKEDAVEAPGEQEGATPGEQPPGEQPEDQPDAQEDDKPQVSKVTKPASKSTPPKSRTPVKRSAAVEKPKNTAAAARSKAVSQYKAKNFQDAAQTLRSAAEDASRSEAEDLRWLASNYEKIGNFMDKGDANLSKDPAMAFDAYRRALSLDKKAGDSAHQSLLRSKLGVVAPKAAATYMAKDKLESAKSAADAADSYGSGSNPTVKRVRQGLERKAEEFYKSALRLNKEPAKAKALLKRILAIVPTSSPWYTKAYKRLNSR